MRNMQKVKTTDICVCGLLTSLSNINLSLSLYNCSSFLSFLSGTTCDLLEMKKKTEFFVTEGVSGLWQAKSCKIDKNQPDIRQIRPLFLFVCFSCVAQLDQIQNGALHTLHGNGPANFFSKKKQRCLWKRKQNKNPPDSKVWCFRFFHKHFDYVLSQQYKHKLLQNDICLHRWWLWICVLTMRTTFFCKKNNAFCSKWSVFDQAKTGVNRSAMNSPDCKLILVMFRGEMIRWNDGKEVFCSLAASFILCTTFLLKFYSKLTKGSK